MKLLKLLVSSLSLTLLMGQVQANEMVLTSEVPLSHWKSKYMQEFADSVTKLTNGELTVKLFPAGQLHNDKNAVSNLGTGTVHMVWPVSSVLESLAPETGLVSIPFVLTDEYMLKSSFSKGLASIISEPLEKRNVEVLGMLRSADSLLLFKNKVVRQPEDLKGLKIRTIPGNRALRDAFIKIGASPVALPASEISSSLAQGVIDGLNTSPAGWFSIVGNTATQGILIPGMYLATYSVVVDKKWYQGLPTNQRKAVDDSIATVADRQWKEAIVLDEIDTKKMVAGGATFWAASKTEVLPWRDVMKFTETEFRNKYPAIMVKYDELVKQHGQ